MEYDNINKRFVKALETQILAEQCTKVSMGLRIGVSRQSMAHFTSGRQNASKLTIETFCRVYPIYRGYIMLDGDFPSDEDINSFTYEFKCNPEYSEVFKRQIQQSEKMLIEEKGSNEIKDIAISQSNNKIEELLNQISILSAKVDMMEVHESEQKKAFVSLVSENDRLKEEKSSLNRFIEELKRDKEELKRDKEELRRDKEILVQQLGYSKQPQVLHKDIV